MTSLTLAQVAVDETTRSILQIAGELLIVALLVLGTLFCVLGAVGMARMPDLYSRMQASTKAGTLGVVCLLLATAIHAASLMVFVEGVLIVLFLFLTSPIASHLIARSSYFVDVPRWKNTQLDELRGCYDRTSHRLDPHGDEGDLGSAPPPIPHPAGRPQTASNPHNQGESEPRQIRQAR